jgi:TctA family transporter
MKLFNKKGDLSWQLIALMIVGIMVLVIIILFSSTVQDKVTEGIQFITVGLLGR